MGNQVEAAKQKTEQVRNFVAQMWALESDVRHLENAITKCKATGCVPKHYRFEGLLGSLSKSIRVSHMRVLRLCSLAEEVLHKREKEKDNEQQ